MASAGMSVTKEGQSGWRTAVAALGLLDEIPLHDGNIEEEAAAVAA